MIKCGLKGGRNRIWAQWRTSWQVAAWEANAVAAAPAVAAASELFEAASLRTCEHKNLLHGTA